jgi:c(7)-type cytochrome triheme protein
MSLLKTHIIILTFIVFCFTAELGNAGWFSHTSAKISSWLFVKKTGTLGFTHKTHVVEEELDCQDCHTQNEVTNTFNMPTADTCIECHEDDEYLTPTQLSGNIEWANFNNLSKEVIFSHKSHTDEELDCNTCHSKIESSNYISEKMKVTMDTCIQCHKKEEKFKDESCSNCHKELDIDKKPSSHSLNFEKSHGSSCKQGQSYEESNCSICHKEDSCNACHQTTSPRNHNMFFKRKGHGLHASMDSDSCATCHQQDSCDRCHAQTEPISHKGNYGMPRNNHCISCHTPLEKKESCFACHKTLQSHETANMIPKNSQHKNIKDCRECHTKNKLTHFDNGDSCLSCHK